MRKIALMALSVFLLSAHSIKAENNSGDALMNKLMQVNAEWEKQPEAGTLMANTTINNAHSFNDWIATHLMLVESVLSKRDVSNLSATQQANRKRLLAELNGYWHLRPFPVNNYVNYKTPVFIDRTGNHCAVGYLMQQSGAESLARKIDAEQKFAYVRDIKVGGVKEWADENGFTLQELAWIQPSYPAFSNAESMGGGLNGAVNTIAIDPATQNVYAAGTFTQAASGPYCNNIAVWISGISSFGWVPLGPGTNGTVNAIVINNNMVYAAGEFTTAGGITAPHVAVFDIGTGQWQALGALDSTVRALTFFNGDLYAGGDFTGNVAKWTGSNWQAINGNLITGSVRALEVYNNMLVIGGNFDIATGAPRQHAIGYDGNQLVLMGFGTPTPVNDFETHLGKLYAACDVAWNGDSCALAFFDGNDWQVDIKPGVNTINSYFSGNAISKLVSVDSTLYAAGDFNCGGMMFYGANLMAYRKQVYAPDTTVYSVFDPLALPDAPVKALALAGNQLYFGGQFVFNLSGMGGGDSLNHVAYLATGPFNSVRQPQLSKVQLTVYPNPSKGQVRLQCGEAIKQLQVLDINGKEVLSASNTAASPTINLEGLSSGTYFIKVVTAKGAGETRFVKE